MLYQLSYTRGDSHWAATPAGAQDPSDPTTTSTAPTSTSTTIAELPLETAVRATPAIQVTPTDPPPPTTTLPPDPCASLPANSGEGRRLIYSKTCQRVWAVDADSHFVRPGPRVVDGAEVVAAILHPELVGVPAADRARRSDQ